MKLSSNLVVIFCVAFSCLSFAETSEDRLVREDKKFQYIEISGIPGVVRFPKDQKCAFSNREISLIRDVLKALPVAYEKALAKYTISKSCLNDGCDKELTSNEEVVLGKTTSREVIIDQLAFSQKKDGKRFQLTEDHSRRVITHELTHVMDNAHDLSEMPTFRAVNVWKHNALFQLRPNSKLGEGHYRKYGATNPKEDLATSAEGYFWDANFICQQPAMYSWFRRHIGDSNVEPSNCPELQDPIDPDQISAAGVLLVSAAPEKTESKFGHSLLHLHDQDNDPFNDFVIEAAASWYGAPIVTGFESKEEQKAKLQKIQEIQPNRIQFLTAGALGKLPMNVASRKFQMKWLDTVMGEGRDINERLLDWDPIELRILVYILNKDIKRDMGKYKFFSKNCATYIANVINMVESDRTVTPRRLGIYTPKRIYEQTESIQKVELPRMIGDRTRLAGILPRRIAGLKHLKGIVSGVNLKILEKTAREEDKEVFMQELTDLGDEMRRLESTLTNEDREAFKNIFYTFTVENGFEIQKLAIVLYSETLREITSH